MLMTHIYQSLPPLGRDGAPHTAGWGGCPTYHRRSEPWRSAELESKERRRGGGRRGVVACRVKNKEGAIKEEKAQ